MDVPVEALKLWPGYHVHLNVFLILGSDTLCAFFTWLLYQQSPTGYTSERDLHNTIVQEYIRRAVQLASRMHIDICVVGSGKPQLFSLVQLLDSLFCTYMCTPVFFVTADESMKCQASAIIDNSLLIRCTSKLPWNRNSSCHCSAMFFDLLAIKWQLKRRVLANTPSACPRFCILLTSLCPARKFPTLGW
jgi:hypothetical protein